MALAMFFVATTNRTTMFNSFANQPLLWIIPGLSLLSILVAGIPLGLKKAGLSFTLVSLAIFTLLAAGFAGMFPNMLPSKLNPAYSLTLFKAAGSQLNLTIMLWVALFIVPVVIAYQLWMYRIFKDKITGQNAKGYH